MENKYTPYVVTVGIADGEWSHDKKVIIKAPSREYAWKQVIVEHFGWDDAEDEEDWEELKDVDWEAAYFERWEHAADIQAVDEVIEDHFNVLARYLSEITFNPKFWFKLELLK